MHDLITNMLHQWNNSQDKIPGDPGESKTWATLCERLPGDPSWKAMDWPEVWRGRHPYDCRETSRGNWPDDGRGNGLPKYHGQGSQNWSWYEVTYSILPLNLELFSTTNFLDQKLFAGEELYSLPLVHCKPFQLMEVILLCFQLMKTFALWLIFRKLFPIFPI